MEEEKRRKCISKLVKNDGGATTLPALRGSLYIQSDVGFKRKY